MRDCEDRLHSTLEDWIWIGLKLGHSLPVIENIDLNKETAHGPLDPCKNVEFLLDDCVYLVLTVQFQLFIFSLWATNITVLAIPSNSEYSIPQLRMMIQEVENIIGRNINIKE
ncbi:MAG: hypothetical protein QF907_05535 [Nitrospinota bacterium]|nr:hypothetical protein [Nitrospinota bacterium]MDP7580978.1 hypothetical protein [Nitrospinota bacterium]HJN03168.1 hypothetical protein [Nitrospinota bacterium]